MPEIVRVVTADGWDLGVRVLHPPGSSMGVAIVGHAMMVDGRVMDRPEGAGLAAILASSGWTVWIPDLRGRGLSGPTVAEGGSWSYDDLVRFDLPALVAAARAAVPGACWVVGNSLAGHVSAAAAGTGAYAEPPDGHVFFAVNTWDRRLEPFGGMWLRKEVVSWGLRLAALVFGRLPARRFRLGPVDEARPYAFDIARFWFRGWRSRTGVDYLAALGNISTPVLAFLGKGDRLFGAPGGARSWVERWGGPVDCRLVGAGDYGLSLDPGHVDIVADPSCAPLWHEAARFLAAHTPSLRVDADADAR